MDEMKLLCPYVILMEFISPKNKDGTRISNSIASEKWSTVSNEFYQQPENDSDNHQETLMGGWETTKLV